MVKKRSTKKETKEDKLKNLRLKIGSYNSAINTKEKQIRFIMLSIKELEKRRDAVFQTIMETTHEIETNGK